jgi:hypothetical protein
MIPSKHARSLYFTPRTPWGRYPQNRPAQSQNYLRASQDQPAVPSPDEKHKLWGTEQQGLGAQMATSKAEWRNGAERTLDKRSVPRDLSSQIVPQVAAGTYDKLAMVPPSAPPTAQNPQLPQSDAGPLSSSNLQKAQQATLHQWRFATPATFGNGKPDQHVEGSISAEGEGGLRPGSIEGEMGFSLPKAMYTGPTDYIKRGPPPPTKTKSGRSLKVIDKRVAPLNQDPEDYPPKDE